ncbi:MAG: hypothetical protein QM751_05300 [Paludibacteraceae bacterium]
MKSRFLVLLSIISIVLSFSACNLGNGFSEATPQIYLEKKAKLNTDSIIEFSLASDYSSYKLDTLHVGDTVSFKIFVDAYTNQVKQLNITPSDTTAVKLLVADSIKTEFLSQSDFNKGIFYLPPNVYGLEFSVKFTTRKAKETLSYTLNVTSDAKKVTNVSEVKIQFPIK